MSERDRMIETARRLTTQLNELHRQLGYLGVIADVKTSKTEARIIAVISQAPTVITVSYTQQL